MSKDITADLSRHPEIKERLAAALGADTPIYLKSACPEFLPTGFREIHLPLLRQWLFLDPECYDDDQQERLIEMLMNDGPGRTREKATRILFRIGIPLPVLHTTIRGGNVAFEIER